MLLLQTCFHHFDLLFTISGSLLPILFKVLYRCKLSLVIVLLLYRVVVVHCETHGKKKRNIIGSPMVPRCKTLDGFVEYDTRNGRVHLKPWVCAVNVQETAFPYSLRVCTFYSLRGNPSWSLLIVRYNFVYYLKTNTTCVCYFLDVDSTNCYRKVKHVMYCIVVLFLFLLNLFILYIGNRYWICSICVRLRSTSNI
jgi:hypothetical protein